jgi:hypothetical protein
VELQPDNFESFKKKKKEKKRKKRKRKREERKHPLPNKVKTLKRSINVNCLLIPSSTLNTVQPSTFTLSLRIASFRHNNTLKLPPKTNQQTEHTLKLLENILIS